MPCGFLCESVNTAVNICIVALIIIDQRIDDTIEASGCRSIVEVNEIAAIHLLMKDRKLFLSVSTSMLVSQYADVLSYLKVFM